ncbi:MAG: phosphoribosylamine--glycine ligase [Terriglobales bacterium]
MKVLVIGGGGREHAIAWRLQRSPSVREVVVAPGNPGCAQVATCIRPPSSKPHDLLDLANHLHPDLTIVGPEAPLVDGVVDLFRSNGHLVFGPSQAAARLEGSKIFAKEFMLRHRIPTARYVVAVSEDEANKALDSFSYPIVLKADGLAAGKGVVICPDRAAALSTLHDMLSGNLVGAAGRQLVIEEFLSGEEISFIGLCDGESVLPLEPSQDHKTIFEDDLGPNTGGMGAYSDSRLLSTADRELVVRTIMQPVLDGMQAEGSPFVGFLYAGLMMTTNGPQVLEFNVRLGDPETQALLHRLDCDFGALVHAAALGRQDPRLLRFRQEPSICVVLAAHGYPGAVRSGDPISGLKAAAATGATVFHAATRDSKSAVHGDQLPVETAGGRVLGVTHSGSTLQQAIANVYAACDTIHFDGLQLRRDIGRKGLKRWH